MAKWEYLICYSFDRGVSPDCWTFRVCGTQNNYSLESLGKEGWELAGVSSDGERYIFKKSSNSYVRHG